MIMNPSPIPSSRMKNPPIRPSSVLSGPVTKPMLCHVNKAHDTSESPPAKTIALITETRVACRTSTARRSQFVATASRHQQHEEHRSLKRHQRWTTSQAVSHSKQLTH